MQQEHRADLNSWRRRRRLNNNKNKNARLRGVPKKKDH
jgi:hypothetical protein